MNRFQGLDNLGRLYKKSRKPWYRTMIIFTAFIILGFAMLLIDPNDGTFALAATILFLSLIVILIIGLIAWIFSLMSKKALKQFTDDELMRINYDIPDVPEFQGFIITQDALIYCKSSLSVIRISDILWVYKQITTNRVNGISTGKSYSAVIALKNKKSKFFATNKKDDLMEFLHSELTKYRKGIFFGYSDQYHALYNMYIDRMIQMSEEAERK